MEAFALNLRLQRKLYYKIFSLLREQGSNMLGVLERRDFQDDISEPWAGSVIVYGMDIEDESYLLTRERGRQEVDALLEMTGNRLALELSKMGVRAKAFSSSLPEVDLRKLAVKAGLGVYGRNGLVLTESYGPRVRFGALAISIPLEKLSARKGRELCRGCRICTKACPAGAIGEGFDACACDDYNASLSEKKCTVCTDVCPVGG